MTSKVGAALMHAFLRRSCRYLQLRPLDLPHAVVDSGVRVGEHKTDRQLAVKHVR